MNFVLSKLGEHKELHFLSIVDEIREKIRLVVTFIALLELTKMGKIGIKESSEFNDFVVYLVVNG